MTSAPERAQAITETVHRYIELVGGGDADALVGLYATDATLEDPVGDEAAFHFALTITNGDHRMRIEPIDVMVFDGDGKIAGMKAYWSAENITQL